MAPTIAIDPAAPLNDRITEFLPAQGSFEIQHDQPGRTHNWHRHSLDETLFIVEGTMTLFWQENGVNHEQTCGPNTRVTLPANTLHGSTAGASGCFYLIAPENGATAVTTFPSVEEDPAS